MTSKPKWYFEPVGPMGGATGNAFANVLQAAGIDPEAELAREAIQNSCDAAKEGPRRVRVVFRIVALEGDAKQRFIEALSLAQGIGKRMNYVSLARDNCLAEPERPLHLLFVEDYETKGLSGDPHQRWSHFHRLLLSVGDSTKALESRATGGSYGYGKSALSLNSRLRTIVAYSAFRPDETGATARLMGCAYLDAHEFKGKQWTGRGWFGVRRAGHEIIVDPLRDEEAHAFAELLGFRSRRNEEHGTSILIVDSHAHDHQRILRGIEEWWWPRLLDQELEVVVEAEGKEYFPQPKQRQDLLPFIECYSLAVERAQPAGPHQKSDRFNRLRGLSLGGYGLQVLPADLADEFPEEKLGRVALIRSPKMVVEYAQMGRSTPAAVGVFLADSDIDDILKLSEPPNHDRWDPESRRLEVAKPDEDTAREVVRQVRKRLKDQMRKLQAQASPPRPREERRLRFLERELGALFRPPMRGDGWEGVTDPVEIRFREGPAIRPCKSDSIETFATVALRLRSDAEDDSTEAIVRVRVPVLEDDHGREGDLLQVTIEFENGNPAITGQTESEFPIELSKSEWRVFRVRSAPYDHRWATKVDVQVESQEGGS
ncbi:hypothetical protein PYK22_01394 [Pyrinomonas methylaliphatogenes]|uniref:Uncharacterized protein n=2 Tax=Pyrinomonas methylaliphatogenes TaxID=454194 RepID=A0A0B6WZ05_9BACT|nr:hypothetical protein PYK22_01394 [Pyrinomonas methylaliphatogenes]